MVGTALAAEAGKLHWPSALACLLGAILIQIGTNYANDYYDFKKGTDTADRIGPTRATQAGWVTPKQMLLAFVVTFALAGGCAAYLASRAGAVMLGLLAVSIVCGILYTAGPFPLGYNGLGDLFAFIFFGPVACAGTWYVQALELTPDAVIAGLAPGFFSVAMIDVNNTRDIDQDRKAGKRTLAVIFGRSFARFEYLFALLTAACIPPILWLRNTGSVWQLLSLLFLLPAIPAIRIVFTKDDGPSLNRALALTGVMLLIHSALFSLGLLL